MNCVKDASFDNRVIELMTNTSTSVKNLLSSLQCYLFSEYISIYNNII